MRPDMIADERNAVVIPFPLSRAMWLLRPILERPNVQRINLSWFVELGAALQPAVAYRSDIKPAEGQMMVFTLKPFVDQLLQFVQTRTFPLYLRSSISSLREMQALLQTVLNATDVQQEYDNLKHDIWMKAFDVERLLKAELSIQPTYMVFPKRAYDIEALISDGTQLFSEECKQSFSDGERYDLNQATKCLVFEVPTAAGFHIFRAVESVIRRYYHVVVGKLPEKRNRNWGSYIQRLRECGADVKITSVLEQIKELYRNPLVHPETRLSMDEALSLIGIAETAISTMTTDLKKRTSLVPVSALDLAFSSAAQGS
jgi:hypothetical protein